MKQKRFLLYIGVALSVSPLLIFKYTNFVIDSVENIFNTEIGGTTLLAPLGISFYTFQALGYLFDIYYDKIKIEKDIGNYALFVCFFPQIVSGPISKAHELLPQIKSKHSFDYDKATRGCKKLLWGMFLKVAVADRLGLFVDCVFNDVNSFSSLSCIIACLFYSIQIYCDFNGYSLMAIGVANLMGYELINNFNNPYFSTSITDFWRRWHISLSRWLKDYVYIPLGGSREGVLRTYLNIMLTFFISGIWHGANWTFIVWGIIHGVVQCIEKYFGWVTCKNKSRMNRCIRIMFTFMIVSFAWVLFRSPDFLTFTQMLNRIADNNPGGIDLKFGSPHPLVILLPLLIFMFSEINDYFFNKRYSVLYSGNKYVRWSGYICIITMIFAFGCFDSSSFIYANF